MLVTFVQSSQMFKYTLTVLYPFLISKLNLPGQQHSYVMMVRMINIFEIHFMLPLTEAVQSVLAICIDGQVHL